MLKRTITGAIYVAIIVGIFCLREYVDYRLFNILIFAFLALGTFEVARAVKGCLYKGNFALAVIFGALLPAVFCAFEYLTAFCGAFACLILSGACIAYQAILAAVKGKTAGETEFKNAFFAFCVNALPFFYPALLLLTVLCANELDSGFICLLLIFVIPPCADTFAYLVGMTYNKIRKGNAKKMCPRLSPKKTWAGAIGGVIGGVVGTIIVYFTVDKTVLSGAGINLFAVFMIVGIIASVLTEIGDLFESYIKRKVGLKDMGKILPGHGGIMDRIDGTVFAAAFIYLIFALI